jgi:hypothetical protein
MVRAEQADVPGWYLRACGPARAGGNKTPSPLRPAALGQEIAKAPVDSLAADVTPMLMPLLA